MVGGGNKSKYFFMKNRRSGQGGKSKVSSESGTGNQKSILNFFEKKNSEGNSECQRKRVSETNAENNENKRPKLMSQNLQKFSTDNDNSVCDDIPDWDLSKLTPIESKTTRSSSPVAPQMGQTPPTPLEKQVIDFKNRYPNMILFVECGYRYRFFGEDARIASKLLDISCHPDRNFLTASVPTFNGPGYYARKFVSAGHKVGIVSQTETASAKATASSSSSGPFSRDVTEIYTPTTFIGDHLHLGLSESMAGDPSDNVKSVLMAIYEIEDKQLGMDIGIFAVQPSSGQIFFDQFIDDKPRNELQSRLDNLQPKEVLISDQISDRTKSAIRFYVDTTSDKSTRMEVISENKFSQFNEFLDTVSENPSSALCQMAPDFPKSVSQALSAIYSYLKEFGMKSVLVKSNSITRITETMSNSRMYLPSMTLRNLELFQTIVSNPTNKGTLFHVLNLTKSRPGSRLLKDWLSAPLMDLDKINTRLDVIEFIMKPQNQVGDIFKKCLYKLVDLEVGLMTILYRKVSPRDFVRVCEGMKKAFEASKLALMEDQDNNPPEELVSILEDIRDGFCHAKDILNNVDLPSAKDSKFESLFLDWSFAPKVEEKKNDIKNFEKKFEEHKKEICKELKVNSFSYSTVSGLEYLVEVKHDVAKSVPTSWTKVNNTKQVVRYRTPFVISNLPKLQYLRECLTDECKLTWTNFLSAFVDKFNHFQLSVKRLAELDCLIALAQISNGNGFCRPTFTTDEQIIQVTEGRNIVLESLLSEDKQYVPNDINLGKTSNGPSSVLILTGPNMGGKSCYLRQVALIPILAQIGCYVPAQSAHLSIFDSVFVRMGARDDMLAGKSTLMVEADDAALILRKSTSKSLVLMDELGRGTSTSDGCAIAQSVLKHLAVRIKCLTIFITHFRQVAEDAENEMKEVVANMHMGYLDNVDAKNNRVCFLFKLAEGICDSSFGMNVARMAGIEENVVEKAKKIADIFQDTEN